jgi:aspartate/glutamate racemase
MASDAPLTPEQLARAATFLFGAATQAEKMGQSVIVVPVRTAHAVARAILGVLNA